MTSNIVRFVREDNTVAASLVSVTAFTLAQYSRARNVLLFHVAALTLFNKEQFNDEIKLFVDSLDSQAKNNVIAYAVRMNQSIADRLALCHLRRSETLVARIETLRSIEHVNVSTNDRLISKNKALHTVASDNELIDFSVITLLNSDKSLAQYRKSAQQASVKTANVESLALAERSCDVHVAEANNEREDAQVQVLLALASIADTIAHDTSVNSESKALKTTKSTSKSAKRLQRLADKETALALVTD